MQFVDQAFADSLDWDAQEQHFLEEIGGIGLIAADAAKVLRHHQIKAIIQGTDQKGGNAGPVFDVGARDGFIVINFNNVIAFTLAKLPAAADLILGTGFLFVC
nr:hypothetical protein [Thalassospira marina]